MQVRVREYHPQDLSSVQNLILNAENFGEPFLEHELLRIEVFEAFKDFGKILVAEDGDSGKIIGYSAIQFEWRALVIVSIITHHQYLRKGVGKALIDKIKEIAESSPLVNVIRVDTGDFMTYAQDFYLSCGFEKSCDASHYLSWNNDQVIFVYKVERK